MKLSILITPLLAEFIGTFILVLFGIFGESSALYFGSTHFTAGIWGIAVTIGICISAQFSGGHLNPAVSLSMAIYSTRFFANTPKFSFRRCFYYVLAQISGATLAGVFNYAVFHNFISRFEKERGLVRGQRGSELSAAAFACFHPSPGLFKYTSATENFDYLMTPANALMVEALSTAILVFSIFSLTNCCNKAITKGMEPFYIGLVVTVLIAATGPLTGGALNPARDLGPRLAALMFGWGYIAFPGPQNGFWAYWLGPVFGGVIGGGIFHSVYKRSDARNCACDRKAALAEKKDHGDV